MMIGYFFLPIITALIFTAIGDGITSSIKPKNEKLLDFFESSPLFFTVLGYYLGGIPILYKASVLPLDSVFISAGISLFYAGVVFAIGMYFIRKQKGEAGFYIVIGVTHIVYFIALLKQIR